MLIPYLSANLKTASLVINQSRYCWILWWRWAYHHNSDQATRRPHLLNSICVQSYGALVKALRLFMVASMRSQSMFSQIGFYRHFRWFPTGWLKSENGTFLAPGLWVKEDVGLGTGPSLARPGVAISSRCTVYLLLFLCYLAGSTSVSATYLTVRPEYDDNYDSRCSCFVEEQKHPLLVTNKQQ